MSTNSVQEPDGPPCSNARTLKALKRRVRLSEELAPARLGVLHHLNGHPHQEHPRQRLEEQLPHPVGHRVRGGLPVVQVDHQRGQDEAERDQNQAEHQIPVVHG